MTYKQWKNCDMVRIQKALFFIFFLTFYDVQLATVW